MHFRDRLNKKLEVIHEHFNFKDFIGLSALIFGLLLSNTSQRKVPTLQIDEETGALVVQQPVATPMAPTPLAAKEATQKKTTLATKKRKASTRRQISTKRRKKALSNKKLRKKKKNLKSGSKSRKTAARSQ